ncbi:MAG: glycosyltransferase family 39 protein [Gemmatimonadetes bacterium]|nr:glycosyltransferase family 39 protein [Gemmatimonadota bacterium]
MLLGVGLVAAVLRLLHAESLLVDPLHFAPLGGNLPLLIAAEEIASGNLVPFDGPISLNSPLYPYLLAALYQLVGISELHAVRLVTGVLDAGTCALVALMAFRRSGPVAGWAAGLSLAVFGPMIFFAADLNPVPFTLLFLTGGVVLLDGPAGARRFAGAGLLLGLAAATRPNVLLAGILGLAVPWARRLPRPALLTLAVGGGVALGVAPITLLNVAASGEPVMLTTSGGHNFYIGHNPMAEAQYMLPQALDGDIFASMKALAEDVERRPMDDTEVSGWYYRRGLAHVAADPGKEAALLGRRALLLLNDFEATTYANYYYQREFSPVLRWAPTLRWLLLLAAPGMLLFLRPRDLPAWLPFLTAAATELLIRFYPEAKGLFSPEERVGTGITDQGHTGAIGPAPIG